MSAQAYYQIIAAQNAANRAQANINKFSGDANADRAARDATLGKLESLSGTPTEELSKQFRDYFNKVMTETTSKFSADLTNYTPGLLGSSSYSGAMSGIGGQMNNYSTALLKDMGTVNSALATAAEAASGRVGNQAFNYAKDASSTTKTGLENLINISASNIGSLRNTTGAGTGLLSATGQRGSERLYGTLAAPIASFQRVQGDQAFSNLYNPYFMRIASAPSTRRSDVGSMQDLYTYNV